MHNKIKDTAILYVMGEKKKGVSWLLVSLSTECFVGLLKSWLYLHTSCTQFSIGNCYRFTLEMTLFIVLSFRLRNTYIRFND